MERPYCGCCEGGDLRHSDACPERWQEEVAPLPAERLSDAPDLDGSLGPAAREGGHAYIYCIAATDGPMKIGVSGDVFARRASLQCGHPERLEVWFAARAEPAALAYAAEAHVHRMLSDRRLQGEWFAVDGAEAAEAVCSALRDLAEERLK